MQDLSSLLPEGIRLIRQSDVPAVPWKNGAGLTREIMVWPPGADFETLHWRVSAATVAQAGPFSHFDGMERLIVLTQGASVVLRDEQAGTRHVLLPLAPYRFAGEARIVSELPQGAAQDFNLMWRRSLCNAALTLHRGGTVQLGNAGSVILHCAAGRFAFAGLRGQTIFLETGDTLFIENTKRQAVQLSPCDDGSFLLDGRIRPLDLTDHPETATEFHHERYSPVDPRQGLSECESR